MGLEDFSALAWLEGKLVEITKHNLHTSISALSDLRGGRGMSPGPGGGGGGGRAIPYR
jgi:hypothetical protein